MYEPAGAYSCVCLFSSVLTGVWIVPLKAGIDYQLDMEFLLIKISVTRM